MQYKTFFGLSLQELAQELDKELPAEAYTAVPGGANLTDIDPGYMKKELNHLFGLCGVFWGLSYEATDLVTSYETRSRSSGGSRSVFVAALKKAVFWFTLFGEDGTSTRFEIPASGGSENDVASYAMKGALTNALGNAVSNIGWQESVYLGQRSHKTVGRKKPAPAPTTKPAPAKPASAPTKPVPAPKVALAQADNSFVVKIGRRSGQSLDQIYGEGPEGFKAIQFYTTMATSGNAEKESLRTAAIQFLEGHPAPQSVAA